MLIPTPSVSVLTPIMLQRVQRLPQIWIRGLGSGVGPGISSCFGVWLRLSFWAAHRTGLPKGTCSELFQMSGLLRARNAVLHRRWGTPIPAWGQLRSEGTDSCCGCELLPAPKLCER